MKQPLKKLISSDTVKKLQSKDRFIPVNELVNQIRAKSFETWFDRLTFLHIFVIWASVIVLFGVCYYVFTTPQSYLHYNGMNAHVSLWDHIYFSFITATTTGFGDIIPVGYFKLIAILQVIFGLLLLAFVTSKLVSIKQDIILNEIYEISFNERINRLRSSLLVFRQNLGRLLEKMEDKSVLKREISDLYVYLSSFEDALHEIHALMSGSAKSHYKKVLDPLNTEVLYNSVLQSFEKLNEFIHQANFNKLEWRREINIEMIHKCLIVNEALFERLMGHRNIPEKIRSDLMSKKKQQIELIKSELPKEDAVSRTEIAS